MTPFAKHLHQSFQDALNSKPANDTPTSVLCEWEQSCRAESIARELAECGAFQLQQQPKPWRDLSPEVQQRFRHKAERAIVSIDVAFMDRAMEDACREVDLLLNGPYPATPPTVRQIAREVVSIYEAILSAGPAVTR